MNDPKRMTMDDLTACDSGTAVAFRDGTVGALVRWYAGTGTGGVYVKGRERLVEIDPDLFTLVNERIVEI